MVGLTNKEKKELKNVFDLFDTDSDGKITIKEISKVVNQLSEYSAMINDILFVCGYGTDSVVCAVRNGSFRDRYCSDGAGSRFRWRWRHQFRRVHSASVPQQADTT